MSLCPLGEFRVGKASQEIFSQWISRHVEEDYCRKSTREHNFAEQANAGFQISYVAVVSKQDVLSARGEGTPSKVAFSLMFAFDAMRHGKARRDDSRVESRKGGEGLV